MLSTEIKREEWVRVGRQSEGKIDTEVRGNIIGNEKKR